MYCSVSPIVHTLNLCPILDLLSRFVLTNNISLSFTTETRYLVRQESRSGFRYECQGNELSMCEVDPEPLMVLLMRFLLDWIMRLISFAQVAIETFLKIAIVGPRLFRTGDYKVPWCCCTLLVPMNRCTAERGGTTFDRYSPSTTTYAVEVYSCKSPHSPPLCMPQQTIALRDMRPSQMGIYSTSLR